MQIVENKALVLRTRHPSKYTVIPNSHVVGEVAPGLYEVAVKWGLDEVRVLRNLGVKNVPSPITARYNWPGRHKPFKHQIDTSAFLTLYRRAFVFNEPGTGKTLSALWTADYLMKRGDVRRALILCPLSIMQSAWMQDIGKSVIHRSAIIAHHTQAARRVEMVKGDYEFVIVNYDGLNLIADAIIDDARFDLVIVDECFVAGTRVRTPSGYRAIEKLSAGESVLTSNGRMRIKRLVRKTTSRLVRVSTSDGKEIVCTPEHPFFTDAGWVTAERLIGRRLVLAGELPSLREQVPATKKQVGVEPRPGYARRADLLEILRAEEVPRGEPRRELLQSDAGRTAGQPERDDAYARAASALVSPCKSEGAPPAVQGRQRNGDVASREGSQSVSAPGLGMELPGSVGEEAARLSYELQTRLRTSDQQAGSRDRREQPHGGGAQSAGSKEGSEAGVAWVVSVSPVECGSDTPVFNIEVDGTPNYFVEGALVHNCNAYKSVSTNRWKSLNRIIKPATFLWMMTGTPAAQSPLDAYGLARLVNPAAVPKYFTAWRDKVMNKVTSFKWAAKPEASTLVHEALQPAIRFTKNQCLDLPPVITVTRNVPLTAQQQKYYKMLKDRMLVEAAGETITAINAAAGINKLLQISAGAAYTDTKEVIEFDCAPRLAVLDEVLAETDRKVIVFAPYRHSIDTISAHLSKHGVALEQIHGDVPASKRGLIFKRFQEQQDPRVLVVQPQSAAHGVTLTAADTIVFWGPVMSVETYMQCCARADRMGQDSSKVLIVHIQGSDIERRMFSRLMDRVENHDLLVTLYEEVLDVK